ncbi:MAG TPA: HAMP domain-containing sensor histidine kinase [Cyclobacteriaceae bacterium]|nr:HAMP domain-containing sensor histidine kinase [Cyclobacteriaceae bacterium]
MGLKQGVRNLIIGEEHFIELYSDYKQVILSGQFALIGIAVCSFFGAIEFTNGNFAAVVVFSAANLFLAVSVWLHRIGNHNLAHYFLLIPINVTAYLLASSEEAATGAFVHFISIALAAFIVFGYRFRKYAIISAGFTFLLFAFAYLLKFSILPFRVYDNGMMVMFRLLNFAIATLVCITAVFLLIRLNHKNAVQLGENYKLLTKANTELDRFVYSTSHDLRAPLTSILGLINIVDQSDNPTEIKKYVGMMRDRIFLLDKFIKDITDYSRNNRLEVQRQKINLSQVSQEVWELLKYTPEAKEIDFQLEIPKDVVIETDQNRLKTVLLNLVSNAIRYHDTRKSDRYVRLRYQMNGKGYHIKVEDNGQGIPHSYHTKVFDMFYRANESSKGSGLGLYIVKETVSKMSGTIQLESAPGVGSTFTIKLPYHLNQGVFSPN